MHEILANKFEPSSIIKVQFKKVYSICNSTVIKDETYMVISVIWLKKQCNYQYLYLFCAQNIWGIDYLDLNEKWARSKPDHYASGNTGEKTELL